MVAEVEGSSLGDADGDGVEDLTVRFDRRRVLERLSATGAVPAVVEGFFRSGLQMRGRTTLRILGAGFGGPASEPTP